MYIKATSANDAFVRIMTKLKNHGIKSKPRGMEITELINCCVEISNPRNRIVSSPQRKFNAAYAFGELCWYMNGDNSLSTMEYYSKFMKSCSDDGKTLNSAYGYRIFTGEHPLIPFDQWVFVREKLKEDNDSRQAVIHLHTPNNKKTNDEVCTLTLQFLIRNGKLDMITTMRSNDIVLGFTYDVFNFTVMQELMANELGVEVGTYYHNAASMHIYERNYDAYDTMTDIDDSVTDFGKLKASSIALMCKYENDYRMIGTQKITGKEDEIILSRFVSNFNSLKKIFGDRSKEAAYFLLALSGFALNAMKRTKCSTSSKNRLLNMVREYNENVADLAQYSAGFSSCGNKVIVCGPDGSGKTLLSNNLALIYNTQVQHYCAPSKEFNFSNNYVINLKNNLDVIFDRFFMSEVVYADVFARECRISNDELRCLERILIEEQVVVVFVLADNVEQLEILKSRQKKEDEKLIDILEEINKVYKQYAKHLQNIGVCVRILNVH